MFVSVSAGMYQVLLLKQQQIWEFQPVSIGRMLFPVLPIKRLPKKADKVMVAVEDAIKHLDCKMKPM